MGFNFYEDEPIFDNIIIKISAAFECLHKATVILDDLIDADERRRGEIAFYRTHGNNVTILASSYLISEAYRLFHEGVIDVEAAQIRRDLFKLFNKTHKALFKGALDEQFRYPFTLYESVRINGNVTATLIRNSLMSGYMLKNKHADRSQSIGQLAFQMGWSSICQ